MFKSSSDQIPERSRIQVPFEDGTAVDLSFPSDAMDKMSPETKDEFLKSIAGLLKSIVRVQIPDIEDVNHFMSVEGASLILPDTHGSTELQTLCGDQLFTASLQDLPKYQ